MSTSFEAAAKMRAILLAVSKADFDFLQSQGRTISKMAYQHSFIIGHQRLAHPIRLVKVLHGSSFREELRVAQNLKVEGRVGAVPTKNLQSMDAMTSEMDTLSATLSCFLKIITYGDYASQ